MISKYHQLCESLLNLREQEERTWYHISTTDFGPEVKFLPREPTSSCQGEPDTPRICVSPSLAGCLVAGVVGFSFPNTIYVYTTHAPAVPATGVFDAEVTEEHWILQPAIFKKVGQLDVQNINGEAIHEMQKVALPYYEEDPSYYHHIRAKELMEEWLKTYNAVSLEPAMAEAEEDNEPTDEVPSVPAPGNFHQYTNCKRKS